LIPEEKKVIDEDLVQDVPDPQRVRP